MTKRTVRHQEGSADEEAISEGEGKENDEEDEDSEDQFDRRREERKIKNRGRRREEYSEEEDDDDDFDDDDTEYDNDTENEEDEEEENETEAKNLLKEMENLNRRVKSDLDALDRLKGLGISTHVGRFTSPGTGLNLTVVDPNPNYPVSTVQHRIEDPLTHTVHHTPTIMAPVEHVTTHSPVEQQVTTVSPVRLSNAHSTLTTTTRPINPITGEVVHPVTGVPVRNTIVQRSPTRRTFVTRTTAPVVSTTVEHSPPPRVAATHHHTSMINNSPPVRVSRVMNSGMGGSAELRALENVSDP